MSLLAIGTGFLILVVVLGRLFLSMDPMLLAKVLRWFLIISGVFLAFYLVLRGQALLAAGPAAVAAIAWRLLRIVPLGLWIRLFQMGKAKRRQQKYAHSMGSSSRNAQQSVVDSEWLHMVLDHRTGDLLGTVVKGPFVGQSLDDMEENSLHQLMCECSDDEPSLQLLQSYMERRFGPSWHKNFEGNRTSFRKSNGDMEREEAYEILGLTSGASEEEIIDAHRRLMTSNHPDHGGSSYLAMQINRARDVLLDK